MTFTYDLTQLSTNRMMQVRMLVGDTKPTEPLLQDEEINTMLQFRPNVYGASAMSCRAIANKFSRDADSVQGELRTMYSSRSKAYNARALGYEEQAVSLSGALPIAGGISLSDKEQQVMDPDRVPPAFNRDMTDNTNYPIGPVGNETDTDA